MLKRAFGTFYHISTSETNLRSRVVEGKRQEAGQVGECCNEEKGNVTEESYTHLWDCNVLESVGVDG